MAKKKILLMGKAHSGKTSMRSIIFANYLARDTTRLGPTLDVEHHHVRFLGDLVLNLWDCGGQDAFYESYFERDRETIFRSVELLIYVFDIESNCPEKDFDHFCGVLEAMEENSPDARIFVLVHKMDLVAEEDRESILEERRQLIAESCMSCGVEHFECFGTSIWDETLYKAWSEIVTNLIPNIKLLETHLNNFCRISDADEVVLFERATFLVIAHASYATDEQEKGDVNGSNTTTIIESGSGIDLGTMGGGEDDPKMANSMEPDLGNDQDESRDGNIHDVGQDGGVGSSAIAASGSSYHQMAHGRSPPSSSSSFLDAHRFEKISNIVKQFKLSCGKAQSQFQGMQVGNSRFSAFIDAFTTNTYIMVIVTDPTVQPAATLLNIQNARAHFERFIPRI